MGKELTISEKVDLILEGHRRNPTMVAWKYDMMRLIAKVKSDLMGRTRARLLKAVGDDIDYRGNGSEVNDERRRMREEIKRICK